MQGFYLQKSLHGKASREMPSINNSVQVVGKNNSKRSTHSISLEEYEIEGSESEESFDDNESSSRSDGFGVSGDWGQDDDSEEEDSSILSRSVREIKLTK